MLDMIQITAQGKKGKYRGHVEIETPDGSGDIRLGVSFDFQDTASTYLSAEEALEVAEALIRIAREAL